MAKKRAIDALSARELYQLAKKKERVEKKTAVVNKSKITALKKQRKQVERAFAKELAKIDAQLEKYGAEGVTSTKKTTRRRTRVSLNDQVLEVLRAKGKLSSQALRDELQKKRVNVKYLAQALNTLKKNGEITSPARAVYEAA